MIHAPSPSRRFELCERSFGPRSDPQRDFTRSKAVVAPMWFSRLSRCSSACRTTVDFDTRRRRAVASSCASSLSLILQVIVVTRSIVIRGVPSGNTQERSTSNCVQCQAGVGRGSPFVFSGWGYNSKCSIHFDHFSSGGATDQRAGWVVLHIKRTSISTGVCGAASRARSSAPDNSFQEASSAAIC